MTLTKRDLCRDVDEFFKAWERCFFKGGKDMEIYEKVKKYLFENIGHLTSLGTPRFDVKNQTWKVPVLCKTDRGILIIGEFSLDKVGNFKKIPTKKEMLKTVEMEVSKLPYLFYGTRKELEEKNIEPVAIWS
jgi:hypothetical protein